MEQEDSIREPVDNNNSIKTDIQDNDPNMLHKLEFVLNIQEIPGKKITENYLKELSGKLNAIKEKKPYIQYNYRVVTDTDIEYNKMMGGGGNSSFPFNIFEGLLDKITGRTSTSETTAPSPTSNEVIDNDSSNKTDNSNIGFLNTIFTDPSNNVVVDSSNNVPIDTSNNVAIDSSSNTAVYVPTNTNKNIFQRLFSFIPSFDVSNSQVLDASFTKPLDMDNLVQEPIVLDDKYDGVVHILVTIYDKKRVFSYIGGVYQLEYWIERK